MTEDLRGLQRGKKWIEELERISQGVDRAWCQCIKSHHIQTSSAESKTCI